MAFANKLFAIGLLGWEWLGDRGTPSCAGHSSVPGVSVDFQVPFLVMNLKLKNVIVKRPPIKKTIRFVEVRGSSNLC